MAINFCTCDMNIYFCCFSFVILLHRFPRFSREKQRLTARGGINHRHEQGLTLPRVIVRPAVLLSAVECEQIQGGKLLGAVPYLR